MGPPSPTVRGAPPRRVPLIAAALAVLLLVPTLPASRAAAQTPDEIGTALAALGGGEADAAVLTRLAGLLADADPAVLPPSGFAATDRVRLETGLLAWSDVAQDWRIVGQEFGAQVCACREGEVTAGCGEELQARLWLRHAERLRENLAERFAQAAQLADTDRPRREAALTRERDRAMERLRLLEQGDPALLGELEQDRERLRERLREHVEELGRIGASGQEGRP